MYIWKHEKDFIFLKYVLLRQRELIQFQMYHYL